MGVYTHPYSPTHLTGLSKPTTIYEACRGIAVTGGPYPTDINELGAQRQMREKIIPPLKEYFEDPTLLPKSNSRVIISFIDEPRHKFAMTTVMETFESILQENKIHNVELICICTDLSYFEPWTLIPNDESWTKHGNFDIIYLRYSDKVGLYHKLGLIGRNLQPWNHKFKKLMYLPGHFMNLRNRMHILEELIEIHGRDNVFYTLNLPETQDDRIWNAYKDWMPKNIKLKDWKDYLYSFETHHVAEMESTFQNSFHKMSGIGMPTVYYNDVLCHYMSDWKKILTEKETRCVLNHRPLILQGCGDVLDYEFNIIGDHHPNLQDVSDCMENIRCNPTTQKEILDHNFNTLVSRAEKTYKYLNNIFDNQAKELILQGGLFSNAY
jgi:hypothetical protein